MKTVMRGILAAGLAAFLAGPAAWGAAPKPDQPKPDSGGASLESLLKSSGLKYIAIGEKQFKVPFKDDEGNVSVVIVEERDLALDKPVPYVFIWSVVVHVDGDKVPVPLLRAVAETNNIVKFGNVSLEKDKEGGSTVYLNSSFLLEKLAPEQLGAYVQFNNLYRRGVAKAMQRLIEDQPDGK